MLIFEQFSYYSSFLGEKRRGKGEGREAGK